MVATMVIVMPVKIVEMQSYRGFETIEAIMTDSATGRKRHEQLQ
tara:strand:- start:4623 stop:4754 length:132 start_codon:yes stop_codon:yes gene_type:complete